jgi:superfamily II RNA helicase
MKEFFELKFGSITIDEYKRKFLELLKYGAFIKDERVKIQRYMSGLSSFISDKIKYDDPNTLEETIRRAKCIYDQQKGRPNFQKAWKDKMKNKVEQRKKGTKPSFLKNIAQRQPTLKEPRMTVTMGKKPRQQPIQCWGCGGDHMYRDFPQRDEKSTTAHNVQEVVKVEDMGKHVPRIYAALDNKQVEF